MANSLTIGPALERLRGTRVWKSIFRRGPALTNRTRSLAVFGNLFLHFLPVKVRERSLRVRASYYVWLNFLPAVCGSCCYGCALDVLLPPRRFRRLTAI